MNCKDIQARLIDYLDKKLDGVSTEEMQQHLASCAACSREAEELGELLTAMDSGAANGGSEAPAGNPFELVWVSLFRELSVM